MVRIAETAVPETVRFEAVLTVIESRAEYAYDCFPPSEGWNYLRIEERNLPTWHRDRVRVYANEP
jgi:hypothetical protein